MSLGTIHIFKKAIKHITDGTIILNSDLFKIILITNEVIPTTDMVGPDSSLFSEVTGAGYTSGGESMTTSWEENAGVTTFNFTDDILWMQEEGAPVIFIMGLFYSDTAETTDALAFMEMTYDSGVTPISLQNGDIIINASSVFTLS